MIKKNSNLTTKITRVSVITVSMNNVSGLTETIASVVAQDYDNMQFVVVDGGSKDGTDKLLAQHEDNIGKVLVEQDVGVYHAMNKGVNLADGEWVIFMNSGDVFSDKDILSKAVNALDENVDVLFSDWYYFDSKRVKANIEKLNVRHQSVIYRKSLHQTYGDYLVGDKVSISDYLFFLSVSHLNWQYFDTPISICDRNGLSAKPSHFYQRILSECLFGKRSRWATSLILVLYPAYRSLKRLIVWKF